MEIRQYTKKDAIMTRGYAILCMCVLHLFCCLGADVKGTPLIWLTPEKPLVYWFGFFAEICVPTYSLCAGYAQRLQYENGKFSYLLRAKRVLNLMVNYWIILVIFSIIGLIIGNQAMPGSLSSFVKSIFLLHSYNGAWWYLNTYVILLLMPFAITQFPVKRINSLLGIVICFGIDGVWYLVGHFGLIPDAVSTNTIFAFFYKELINLIDVIPYFWIGGFLCKEKIISRASEWLNANLNLKKQKVTILMLMATMFVGVNLFKKGILIGPIAVLFFILFNVYPHKSGGVSERVFIFLGKHSTNIWLTHMFFYAYLFPGLVQSAKYPLLMLCFLLVLCIVVSYVEMGVQKLICQKKRSF